MAGSLLDNVERWLVHDNYSFRNSKMPDDAFRVKIKHVGSFGNSMEIFEPKNQPNVLVLGVKCPLKNNQNARYLRMSKEEQETFERNVAAYAQKIRAVHRFSEEDGKRIIGVYTVLDREDQINQVDFAESFRTVVGMGEKMTQYLMKTF